jgi:predicted phosphodiesterase
VRIHVLSDLHIEFNAVPHSYRAPSDISAVVLAGDIGVGLMGIAWALRTFEVPVVYVLGNHEYYGGRPMVELERAAREKVKGTHVRLLQNDSILLAGVRFVGCTLWTDFELLGSSEGSRCMEAAGVAMNDYEKIFVSWRGGRSRKQATLDGLASPEPRRGDRLTPAATRDLHGVSRAFLEQQATRRPGAEPVVVVTHHAPSALSLKTPDAPSTIDAAYASRLDSLVRRSGASFWLHGHTHVAHDYAIGGTRVVCNPRGYRDGRTGSKPRFDWRKVIEVA